MPDRGFDGMFPAYGGNKTAPERNGNLAKTDSYAFAELDDETKLRILRFNTDPDRALKNLADKLSLMRKKDQNNDDSQKYAPKVFDFDPNKAQSYIVADNRGTYLLKGRGLRVILDERAETATVVTQYNGQTEAKVYYPLRALSFGREPVYLSPEYNGVHD